MIRLHVDHPLSAGVRVPLGPDQGRYLTTVMRRAVGDDVLLFNGRDGEWRAEITEVGKRSCVLTAVARTRVQDLGPDLDLIVALVKRARLETIVEKAAELGVRRVRLAITQYTQADHTRVDRLSAIAVEASEQTGRLDVPQVAAPMKLDQILDSWPVDQRLMFCDEGGEVRSVLDALGSVPAPASWAILIGPEGGFSTEERARLRGLDFVTPVGLGPRILRADTAAISAMSLWQAKLGDWRS
ncbi:MAG: 16S rRNA (uracil(1498)-N(3))-methyltransferase [Caulobacterales bacterium]|nr:16S rRNA (uracil(1498)-N(3))-methyltransferase [Caulobacterales bacterium]